MKIERSGYWDGDRWHGRESATEDQNVDEQIRAARVELEIALRDYIKAKRGHDAAGRVLARAAGSLREAVGRSEYTSLPSAPWVLGEYVVEPGPDKWNEPWIVRECSRLDRED